MASGTCVFHYLQKGLDRWAIIVNKTRRPRVVSPSGNVGCEFAPYSGEQRIKKIEGAWLAE
ncbi:hypothetical protein PHLCEN_2v187 [Hermanssonia centrifuga]|uniref:Uncharacterized protein n=1 Tax=Hermanssonia centrifuga TaxID=98765 RepID=A0A2R6S731_9APHY|nr:hypothetical protein PHLCEN_2v187 [Hermanssonia centrifuga]